MSHPSWPTPGEPPVQPTAPAPYEAPAGFGMVAPEARRARRKVALVTLGLSLLFSLVTAAAVVVPLVLTARERAQEALDILEAAPLPTLGAEDGVVGGPDRVPAPLDDAPPLAVPVDGRFGLDGLVRFDGPPRFEGEPTGVWVADADDPDVWRRGECALTRQEDEIITFGGPDASTTDRVWSEEGLALRAHALSDDVGSLVPRGDAVTLTVPTSDGARLEMLGQVYDVVTVDGRRVVLGMAARALTWHDVTYYVTLMCREGAVEDPAAMLQEALDAHRLVLP